MGFFDCLLKKKQPETTKVASKKPQDFIEPFYKELEARGIFLLRKEVIVSMDTSGVQRGCGGTPGEFIACQVPDPNKVIIYFDDKYWLSLGDDQRECLAYHELSHGILNLPHAPPMCIMQPALMKEPDYVANKAHHFDVLVGQFKAKSGLK